ncbi:MAG: hypothetical protein VXV91_08155, partial [Verrucomicrobiota bacterium]|nr:hypothetical protein [Verrucomicrobiota bacterium]
LRVQHRLRRSLRLPVVHLVVLAVAEIRVTSRRRDPVLAAYGQAQRERRHTSGRRGSRLTNVRTNYLVSRN